MVFCISTILFWGLLIVEEFYRRQEFSGSTIYPSSIERYILLKSGIKFVFYVNLIMWFNAVYILKTRAEGIDTETWEFQKRQVYMTLFIFIILIIMEIPIWLTVLGSH
ncbi:hypothetical protein ES702_01943 [subsurface metagenome]